MAKQGRAVPGLEIWWDDGVRPIDVRQPLTREQIVDAALRVVDDEGLDALSMRRLGAELGVGATTVYWHVRDKDQLLALVVDRIIGEAIAETPRVEGWREQLTETARRFRSAFGRHRNVAAIMGEQATVGAKTLAAVEGIVGSLRAAGFEGPKLVLASVTVFDWASAFVVFEARQRTQAGPTEAEMPSALAEVLRRLPADRFPNLRSTVDDTARLSSDEQFEYGLARLLDGIELDLERSRAGGAPRQRRR
jgi:AcrR family transcriptional regulator